MSEIPEELLPHEIGVEYWQGVNGKGEDSYAASVTLPAYVEAKRRLVRDRTTGDMVTSGSTIFINTPSTVPAPDTRITLPSGAQADIIDVAVFDFGEDSPTPDHVEIYCA